MVKEPQRFDTVIREAAVLVGVFLPGRQYGVPPLGELEGLAEAAGTRVVGHLTQRRQMPDAAYYLGRGKVDQLRSLARETQADLVIFDNDLSPAQTRNLEKALGLKVLDRTELILDIFATRARTYQARLAVELAQLEYSLPRLKRMWTHLSRQRNGVGLRGPGEKQLEVDRRLATRRIHELRTELQAIERRKQREVAARNRWLTVSLVGYTNAGKSSLLNRLTGADVFTHDMLFATLDTRTRRWRLPGWGDVLLSDTVGFIRDLPHHLIASFKATLEEACQADLLLHVADASNPAVYEQIASAYRVLEEIGIQAKDTLLVINKIDALNGGPRIDGLRNRYPAAIPVSARTGQGLDRLCTAVSETLGRSFADIYVETTPDNGRLMAYLAAHGEVLSKTFHDAKVTIHCRIARAHLGRIGQQRGTIREGKHGSTHCGNGEGRAGGAGQQGESPCNAPNDPTADPAAPA